MTFIWEDVATKLTKELRIFFILLFSFILLFAVVGNLAAIWLALHRKHRLFYKCCVISLSTSDGLMAISTCSYSISMFMHPWVNWTLGEFMCKFIPFAQTLAVLSNSFTLSSIAMDRYQGVVNATQGPWNPSLPACIGVIITIWTIALVVSIPMFLEYYIQPMFVLRYDHILQQIVSYTLVDFCSITSKHRMSIYLSLLFAFIFLPLLLTFLTLYGMIGCFIWMRRPVSGRATSSGEHDEAIKREGREVTAESTSAAPATTFTNTLSSSRLTPLSHSPQPRSAHSHQTSKTNQTEKRKKRILKIIFALMVTFFVTRLPIWCYNIVSANVTLEGKQWWILQYFLSALSLLGTVLNPFLYGFLRERITRNRSFSFHFLQLCPSLCGNPKGRQSRNIRTKSANLACNSPLTRLCGNAQERSRVKPWSIT